MHRAHRNGYDHSVRASGIKLVEVGYAHRTMPDQLAAALDEEQVAVVVYLMSPWASRGALSLEETCTIAHQRGVPVMIDGSPVLPPAENLTRFISAGADLEKGDPRVFLFEPGGPSAHPNSLMVNPHTLQPGEERIVATVLGAALRHRLS